MFTTMRAIIIVMILAVAAVHGKPVENATNDDASLATSGTNISEAEGARVVGKGEDNNLLSNAHEDVPVTGQEASKEPTEQEDKFLLFDAGMFLPPVLTALIRPTGPPAPPPVPQSEIVVLPPRPNVAYSYSSNSLSVEPGSPNEFMIVPPPQPDTPYASNVIFVRPQ